MISARESILTLSDVYQEMLVKNSERSLRGEESGHRRCSINSGQIVRQWRNFVADINARTECMCVKITLEEAKTYLLCFASKKKQMAVFYFMQLTQEKRAIAP